MEGYLNQKQKQYVLFHLDLIIDIDKLKSHIIYLENNEDINLYNGKIIFKLSPHPFNISKIKNINDLPILFPLSSKNYPYSIQNNNLVFHDDLLKSSFYLLSGYQEYQTNKTDKWGRFPYTESIQYKLDKAHIPIVNYYFKMIRNGIKEFSNHLPIRIKTKSIFDNFGFMLTHDIDRLKYYKFYRVKLLIKKLLGLTDSDFSKRYNFFKLLRVTANWINHSKKNDPYWNFKFLRNIEKKHNIRSTFYFLHKDQKDVDSYYNFQTKEFKDLVKYIENENCEIGLHGCVASAKNYHKMQDHYNKLSQISSNKILGIRQHRLIYDILKTPQIQNSIGFKYDTTLGFAEHEGFRNAFCLPFKIFDHNNNEMLDLWEFPLNVMDVTLFFYRNYDFNQAYKSIETLITQIKKFNGLFVLLWHNKRFNEEQIPGFTNFYKGLLNKIMVKSPQNVTGRELISKLKNQI